MITRRAAKIGRRRLVFALCCARRAEGSNGEAQRRLRLDLMPDAGVGSNQRVDQWLWFARITKSRTLAQNLVARGKVRVNRVKIDKPSTLVKAGDVLTVVARTDRSQSRNPRPSGSGVGPRPKRNCCIETLHRRRSRALSGAKTAQSEWNGTALRPFGLKGAGRPTKRERRQIDQVQGPLVAVTPPHLGNRAAYANKCAARTRAESKIPQPGGTRQTRKQHDLRRQ